MFEDDFLKNICFNILYAIMQIIWRTVRICRGREENEQNDNS